ncbi:MdtA/MuxA family multidrug efflux RND transporter periplasmic adaptor subunit [Rhodopila sp.]|uniref:MdtA/MuxA family multidrug efflux RND transporter periplasmic adaptor subunit n=1 Tax=Rhodopila sp. TaxID=2480087 RepID=UPI002C63D623|nr:MdtA/MuxA family multidrug efflux RND transporter periplasmic adaptor subunit [Rhodopila sp.]HVZ08296.1 MdtA/MuxA family multidrug efflux RND transporter periplasmic adaptor subunit [Rhodopila sp.]
MDEQVEPLVRTDPADRASTPVTKRGTRLGRVILLLVLAAAAVGGWYWWTHRHTDSSTAATIQGGSRRSAAGPQSVGVATVGKGDIRVVINALGTVTPLATVNVKTQLNGYLTEVGFKEGQLVQKGDFLAQIDPRPYQVALEQAQGTLAHDTGLLQQAQTNLKRYQTLGRQDSIAQQQVDDQRYLVAQYTGTVQTDQAAIDAAKLNLTYARIVAPIAGRVGLRKVDPGNYVSTSDTTPIVVITQLQPMSVLFAVPEDSLPAIQAARKDSGKLSVDAYDRNNTRQLATGELTTLDNQIDTTTGTVTLRAVFDNGDTALYPNQFVNVRLLVNTLKDVIRVPVQAVQRGEPGTFVYVVGADNKVTVRKIVVGPVDGTYQLVSSGLDAGERVVTDGTDRLRDGVTVTVPAAGGRGQGQGGQGQGGQGQASDKGQRQPRGTQHARDGAAQPSDAGDTRRSSVAGQGGAPAAEQRPAAQQPAAQRPNGQ